MCATRGQHVLGYLNICFSTSSFCSFLSQKHQFISTNTCKMDNKGAIEDSCRCDEWKGSSFWFCRTHVRTRVPRWPHTWGSCRWSKAPPWRSDPLRMTWGKIHRRPDSLRLSRPRRSTKTSVTRDDDVLDVFAGVVGDADVHFDGLPVIVNLETAVESDGVKISTFHTLTWVDW